MEILDIIDKNDKVIGKATRDEVYEKSLCHRIVHILIFNDKGEMALQLRNKTASFYPSHLATSAGGHVRSGETYEKAAEREYKEELGTSQEIKFFKKDFYNVPEVPNKFITTFKTNSNGPFKPNPEDIKKVDFFSIEKIKGMIDDGEKFHPELLFILKKHFL